MKHNTKLLCLGMSLLFAASMISGCTPGEDSSSVISSSESTSTANVNQEAVDAAIGHVMISGYKTVTTSFTVPTQVTSGESALTVVWIETVANEYIDIVSDFDTVNHLAKVVVTRPAFGDDSAAYSLTATVRIGEATASREFAGFITAYTEAPAALKEYDSVAGLYADIATTSYVLTTDTALDEEKVYYTKAGEVYTAVETPVVGDIATYYEDRTVVNDIIVVKGVVCALAFNGYYITDNTNALYIYGVDSTLKLGDQVAVSGKLAIYKTLYQISGPSADIVKRGQSYTYATSGAKTVEEMVALNPAKGSTVHGTIYTVTGVVLVQGSYQNQYLYSTDYSKNIMFYYSGIDATTTTLLKAADCKLVTIDVIYYTNYSNGFAYVLPIGDVATALAAGTSISDADRVSLAKKALTVATPVTANLTLPTTGSYGTTISWATSNAAVISAAGVYTAPSYDTAVTLTATITKGDASDTKVFEVTAKGSVVLPAPSNATDLFISEYIEGTANVKAIEIYNGTGAAVDLSVYSLALYANGSLTATGTTALVGTLANKDVYVVANPTANANTASEAANVAKAAILAVADDINQVYGTGVAFWNGDDAIALLKNGTVIDVFGVIGTDPGSNWTVGTGTTADHTLVRNIAVVSPVATWDASQWDVYDVDVATNIGSHTANVL